MTNSTPDKQLEEILAAQKPYQEDVLTTEEHFVLWPELKETRKQILAWHSKRLQEAMDSIGEPLLTDFLPFPTPDEYIQMINVVDWYKDHIARATEVIEGKQDD